MKNKGFTLIELMVAVFVIVIGVLGTMSVIQRVLFLSSVSYSRLTAAYLAEEGIEIVRNVRDTNWLEARTAENLWYEGLTACGVSGFITDYTYASQLDPVFPCYANQYLNIDSNGFYSYSSGVQTKFKRRIRVIANFSYDRIVLVDVTWTDKGTNYTFTAEEDLYDWR